MDGYAYQTTSYVRFRDVDAMQMANHAVILSYLETTRTEYMMELLEIERLAEIDYVMARVECDYRSPASYGDVLTVGARVCRIGDRSCTMAYRVEQQSSGRLVAEAETVQVFYDYAAETTVEVPDGFRRRLREFQENVSSPADAGADHE